MSRFRGAPLSASLRLSPLLLALAAIVLFGTAFVEVTSRFAALPLPAVWGLLAASAATALAVLHRSARRTTRIRQIVWTLAGATLVVLGARLSLEIERPGGPASAARAADRVEIWLAEATHELGDTAYLLARTPNVAAAVEGSDAADFRAAAFRVLSEWALPTRGVGEAGAALYDQSLRPVAWSGRSPALEGPLAEFFPDGVRAADCPDPAFPLFLYAEQGRSGYLAAAECTRNFNGLVTVELPVLEAAPPSSGAPPASALRNAAQRGLELQIPRGAEDPTALAQLFERRGERFLDGPDEAQRYYFALRAYDGQLLGAASTAVAPEPARRQERRAEAALIAALALLAGAAVAAPAIWGAGLLGALGAIWIIRFALAAVVESLPAGFLIPSLLLPAGGTPPLPGLPTSPLSALLTAVALFLSARLFQQHLRRRQRNRRGNRFIQTLRGAASGVSLVAATLLIDTVGRSGASPLAPTWRIGIGWPEVLGWAALLVALAALLLFSTALLRARIPAVTTAFGVVLAAALLLSNPSVLFATLPLAAIALLITSRRARLALRHLRRPLLSHEPGLAFVVAFLLFAIPPVLFYPTMHRGEEQARRRYAADAAPVQILRHRLRVCHAVEEAARTLDAESARLDPFRPDTAYQLWLATGLARLAAGSAVEVRDSAGETSRFGVGLSRRPDPPPSALAPLDWSPLPECASGSGEDAVLTTTRRFPSGHTVTLRAAVREHEIPFLPQPGGIANHFLLRGDGAPPVFHGKDLRLVRHPAPAEPSVAPGRSEVRIEVAGQPYAVSWLGTGPGEVAAALLGWVFLAALVALLIAVTARLRLLLPGPGGRLRRRSFQMQLTETLAAAVLIAILGLAVFAQQRLSGLLESASDREALARAHTVERVAQELGALDAAEAPDELALRLAHAADQVDTDAALYAEGGLMAVSRPELAQTGLLPPRPPPATQAGEAGIVSTPVFSTQEAGPLRYRIIWLPLETLGPAGGPMLLAVPLADDQAARVGSVRELQRTLFFGTGAMALVFAILLPGLLARWLAAPVRSLARATGQIADGELTTPVPVHGTLAELRLLAASVERLVRRIPSVRRRMREEAAADLARRVAHDIKNALAPIGIAADFIRRVLRDSRAGEQRETPDQQRALDDSVGDILGQVDRLRKISSEFSALGAPLRIETVDPEALVRETVAPYLRAATGPEMSFEAVGSRRIQADPEIVARTVENLLQNALEAVRDAARDEHDEGAIAVRVIAEADAGADGSESMVRIEVEDDGPGVPEDLRERIFDAAFSTRTRGSGLGLANARRFVEAHGGRVSASPRSDGRRGLLLTVELPVAGPEGNDAR